MSDALGKLRAGRLLGAGTVAVVVYRWVEVGVVISASGLDGKAGSRLLPEAGVFGMSLFHIKHG